MIQPTYLWKNNRGIYFFRARIPKQFSDYFTGAEIKKSLQTDSYRLAVKLARVYRVKLDEEMSKLGKGVYGAFQVTLEGKIKAKLPDGIEKLVEGKIERNLASLDELPAHKAYLLKQLKEEAERIEEQARKDALFQAQLAAIAPAPAPAKASTNPPEQQGEPSPLYSEIVKLYLEDGDASNRWTSKNRGQVKSSLMLFQEFVGDLQINSIDKKVTREFKAQYIRTPSNRNKKRQYKDKTITELLGMEIPQEDLIDSGTVHSNMTRIGSFFGWAKDHDYISINPIEGVKPKKNKRKKVSEQRDIFSKEDLAKLFESDEYRNDFSHGGDLWKYWIPLIGLYTGMRLEEICRLRVDCFEFVDDIVTVEIKPDGEWLGKTNAALRAFAVHPKLIDLGLLKFVEQQRAAGKQRLFDELKKGRDGYGARVT